MTPDAYCSKKVGESGSSFYYSFLFLPEQKRKAITALYAFCREVDDIVDECNEPEICTRKLNWWRQDLCAIFESKRPQHPISTALAPHCEKFELPLELLLEIVDGMSMDLVKNRYANFDELKSYCHKVASVVGILSSSIFGFSDKKTLKFAADLGIAFQLTNIIRDVGEDAQRNRIYLPQEDLRKFGVSEKDILNGLYSDAFRQLMQHQSQRARVYYRAALSNLPDIDRNSQLPGLVMAAIYTRILDAVETNNYHVLQRKVSLTPITKLWIAWTTSRKERRLYKQAA
ncbi:presqualene diphosphate synthase HpnD [Pseudomonadota bacterium]